MQGSLGFACVGLMALSTLSACDSQSQNTISEKKLSVVGSVEGIATFVALQGALRPSLKTSVPTIIRGNQLQAVVSLPATFSGTDLLHTTREALAAGLSYRYAEKQSSK